MVPVVAVEKLTVWPEFSREPVAKLGVGVATFKVYVELTTGDSTQPVLQWMALMTPEFVSAMGTEVVVIVPVEQVGST